MPPQISRLVLLTIVIAASYGVARSLITPESFYQYGHFRGDALMEIASREPVYGGKKSCDECHSEILALQAKGPHKTLSCEGCHNASSKHAGNPDLKTTAKLDDKTCMRCHESNPARPAWYKQITLAKHYMGQGACKECHKPHQPNDVP